MMAKAYPGIDAGSVTTRFTVIDPNECLLFTLHLPTLGKPVSGFRDGLRRVKDTPGQTATFRSAATGPISSSRPAMKSWEAPGEGYALHPGPSAFRGFNLIGNDCDVTGFTGRYCPENREIPRAEEAGMSIASRGGTCDKWHIIS